MAEPELVTLDSFFARRATASQSEAVRKVTSLAAELLTDQTDDPTSVWNGEEYGSRLTEIRQTLPGGKLAITAETQRVVDRHAIDAGVSAAADGLQIGINIMVTSEGLLRRDEDV
jgi:hypothetical protein